MKTLTKHDIRTLLDGNSWFATGGGFPAQRASGIFLSLLKRRPIVVKRLDEFNNQDMLCVASGVGSVKKTSVDITRYAKKAVKWMEQFTGEKMRGVVSGETGLECIAAQIAHDLRTPLVDADMKGGRAAPEPSINMFNLYGKSVTPVVTVNTDGDFAVLHEVTKAQKIEQFLRSFANMAKGTFVLWCARPAGEFKKNLIPGTLSRSMQVGSLLHQQESMESVLKRLHGKTLATGAIKAVGEEGNAGFLIRKVTITQEKDEFLVLIKNENLAVLKNSRPIATCPDLITLIDLQTHLGIHNSNISVGQKVAIVVIPHDNVWRTRRGKALFGPKHFGLPYECITI